MSKNIKLLSASLVGLSSMVAFSEDTFANTSYTVKSGDTLYSISKKHNLTVNELKSINKLTSNNIYIGQKLVVSKKTSSNQNSNTSNNTSTVQKTTVKVTATSLNLRSGAGTHFSILTAIPKNTTLDVISTSGKWLKVTYKNKTGFISKDYTQAVKETSNTNTNTNNTNTNTNNTQNNKPSESTENTYYTVKSSDTLYSISTKHKLSVDELKDLNKLTSNTIYVGQKLVVGEKANTTVANPPTESTPTNSNVTDFNKELLYNPSDSTFNISNQYHLVQKGDNLSSIAKKYNLSLNQLRELNGIYDNLINVNDLILVSKNSKFILPTEGRFTSDYGPRWGSVHYGIDIAKKGNIPVIASYGGTVERVEDSDSKFGWGNYIRIKHNVNGKTIYTLYAHLKEDSINVKVGDVVKQGHLIGFMGNTGNSTGQHLHLEVYEDGFSYGKDNVNPFKYFFIK